MDAGALDILEGKLDDIQEIIKTGEDTEEDIKRYTENIQKVKDQIKEMEDVYARAYNIIPGEEASERALRSPGSSESRPGSMT